MEPRTLPSTCTPFSEPLSSQVRQIPGAKPPALFDLFPSWKTPSSDVAITPPHLPPPRSLLTFLLVSPSSIIQNLPLHSTSQKSRGSWAHPGTAAVWTRGPFNYHPPYTHPSRPPSRCHLCFACSSDSLGKNAVPCRRLWLPQSVYSLLFIRLFNVLIVNADTKKCLQKARLSSPPQTKV